MRMLKVFDYIVWIGIITFSCVQQVHGSGKCDLKTFITDDFGSSQEIQDFCIEEFKTAECETFVATFNWDDLPDGFKLQPGTDYAVEEPDEDSAHLAGYYYPHDKYFLPGVELTFGPPPTPNSRKDVKGYLLISERLKYNTTLVDHRLCRIFKVNDTDMDLLQKDVKFTYPLAPVSPGYGYKVRLYTMPPPDSLKDSEDKEFFVEIQASSGAVIYADELNPGLWVPTVTANYRKVGTVEVAISHAPQVIGLNEFTVKLIKYDVSDDDPWRSLPYQGKFAEEELTGLVMFDKVPSGFYKVVVDVKETNAGPNGTCSCYIIVNPGETECRNNCNFVQTDWFNFTSDYIGQTETVTTTPTAPTATQTATSRSDQKDSTVAMSASRNDEDETGLIIGLSCAALVVAVVVAVVVWKFCRAPRTRPDKEFYPVTPVSMSPPMPGISKKKVYIVYAEDHQAHIHLVEQLAHFLQVHCYCDVIFPPWEDVHGEGGGPAVWSRQVFSRADYVLFVDSEAMEKLLASYTHSHVYTVTEVYQSLAHKLLQEASRQVFNNPDIKNKVIAAYLRDRCSCQGYLLATHVFHIPKEIPDLLKCIHRLSGKHAEAKAHSLPLRVENFNKLPEGQNLETALKASHKFEKDEPNWFRERFGEVRPVLQTGISKQSDKSHDSEVSGESGVFSQQGSVSSQDISQLGRPEDSPPLSCHEVETFFPTTQLNPAALCTAPAVESQVYNNVSHTPPTEDNRSVFTIGTNILNRPTLSVAPSSVIPPDCVSVGASTTFSGLVRRFNTENSDPSDITTFSGDGSWPQDCESEKNDGESRSQFEKTLVSPVTVTLGRSEGEVIGQFGEEEARDQFEQHIAAFNNEDFDDEEDEENDLNGIIVMDQSNQPDTVSI